MVRKDAAEAQVCGIVSADDDGNFGDRCDLTCSAIRKAVGRKPRRRVEASRRSKRIASAVAALLTFLIFAWAIHSCIPAEVTTWQSRQEGHQLRSEPANRSEAVAVAAADSSVQNPSPSLVPVNKSHTDESLLKPGRRRLGMTLEYDETHRGLRFMEFAHKAAPNDLKKMHKMEKYSIFSDPLSREKRKVVPLDANAYKLNPLVRPEGYPWHRWSRPVDGSYALNTEKFVKILSRLGRGEDTLGTVTPNNYTVGGVELTPDTIRLGPHVRPYIVRDGAVLRPGGRTGMFVTLVQRAVEMAKSIADESPRMKLLTEGDLPLVFDANDYPWCGDDLVPIFRLNAIKSTGCMHTWPAMSLTYFNDPTNIQLTKSPYEWDAMMDAWDKQYPWNRKIPKVVWRGRITGYTYRDGQRPRQELVRFCRNHLDITDVKPSTLRSKMAQDDFQKYKAILDIDGNAWSARLGKLLCYNSVVIKVEPEYVGYWEKEIKPWVHYVPVEADFSDLEKTVRYVIDPANSEQIKKIIQNGQHFCRRKLTMQQYTVDILWTLLSYAELLANSPDFYKSWRRDESAYRMLQLEMAPWEPQAASTK